MLNRNNTVSGLASFASNLLANTSGWSDPYDPMAMAAAADDAFVKATGAGVPWHTAGTGGAIVQGIMAWAKHGLQRVAADKDTLTMLAATSLSGIDPEELDAPWGAFLVEVPAGTMLQDDGTGVDLDTSWILVWKYRSDSEGSERWAVFVQSVGNGSFPAPTLVKWGLTTSDMLSDKPYSAPEHDQALQEMVLGRSLYDVEKTNSDDRACVLARRIVCGLCLLLASYSRKDDSDEDLPVKVTTRAQKAKHGRCASAITKIDNKTTIPVFLKEAVRDYATGKRGSLKTCHMVRGHWRMQACGEKFSQRRRKWIQPFWKGPVDTVRAAMHTTIIR